MELTIFFDIDGTLINSDGAGWLAMQCTAQELYGVDKLNSVTLNGRTDAAIIPEIFDQCPVNLDESTRNEFCSKYLRRLPQVLEQTHGELLGGVRRLLDDLSAMSNIKMGLLTGNMEQAAQIKLRHFGIEHHFEFGGFGDVHPCRNDVAMAALASVQVHRQGTVEPNSIFVLGDTLHDVRCARAIDANAVAVLTGGHGKSDFADERPDLLFEDFSDHVTVIRAILEFHQMRTQSNLPSNSGI
jgi:phosphoglycolate phosphatase-like HAD superfamily hydrolase